MYTFANGKGAALPRVIYCKNGRCAAFVACKPFEMANRSFAAFDLLQKWRMRSFATCKLLQKWRMRSFAACRRGHQVWHPADEKGEHDVTSPAL